MLATMPTVLILMIVNDGYPQLRECDQFLDEIDRIVSSLAGGRLSQVFGITNIVDSTSNIWCDSPSSIMKIIIITITSILPSRHILKIIVVRTSVTIRDIFIVLVRPLSLVHCFDNILLMLKRLSQETLPFYIPLQVWKKQCLTYQLSQMNCKHDLSESLWPYYSVLPTSIYFSKVGIHIKLRDGLH